MHEGSEFELAYSEIQRETGAANVTMKRAIESLEAEGWLEVKPGRNSRYARFRVMSQQGEPISEQYSLNEIPALHEEEFQSSSPREFKMNELVSLIIELESVVENLRRRLRTQEMTIALLQERVAEIEDKLYKR
jgi:DNA-binding MarR family transcriptional regulator